MGLNASAVAAIRARLANTEGLSDEQLMEAVLRTAAVWRSHLLASSLQQLDGKGLQSGLFAGMHYVAHATEGRLLPRLIGSYGNGRAGPRPGW